jgi:H/ACA ribonucleoprotein complex subunit 4
MTELPLSKVRSTLVRRKSKTDSAYGCPLAARALEQHLRYGVINLDKPSGPTSHEVTAWVKRILGVEKAGHSGTLDPRVTGILPVMLGESTRVVESLLLAGKEYVCLMRLHKLAQRKQILEVCGQFVGTIYQKPPLKAAVSRVLRTREIYYLKVLEIEGQRVLMLVGCEAGTYIRKLCYDLGLALGTGANMEELRRTRAGPFREDETLVTLHQLRDAYEIWRETGSEAALRKIVLPVEAALHHLPRLVISDNAVDAVCHGAPLAAPGLLSLETDINKGDVVALYTLKGEAVALGRAVLDSDGMLSAKEGLVVSTERVIMEPGVYPRRWKMGAAEEGRFKAQSSK